VIGSIRPSYKRIITFAVAAFLLQLFIAAFYCSFLLQLFIAAFTYSF
jgi:hypothetical protein